MTGYTTPGSIGLDPRVRKPAPAVELLALVLGFLMIRTCDNTGVAIHLDAEILRDEQIVVVGLVFHEIKMLLPGLDRAIRLGDDEIIGQNQF